jgi:hypothetical protein
LNAQTPPTADPFAGRLLQGERIVWRGRPQRGLRLTGKDALLIPFSVLWGGFAIFWEVSVLRAPRTPVVMALFGIPFVLIGLFLIIGRFLFDAWVREQVFYALTDRRALMLRLRPTTTFQSVSLDRLPETTLSEASNGRGTIRFGPVAQAFGNRGGAGVWMDVLSSVPQFLAIDDAKAVFASVQDRTRGASSQRDI